MVVTLRRGQSYYKLDLSEEGFEKKIKVGDDLDVWVFLPSGAGVRRVVGHVTGTNDHGVILTVLVPNKEGKNVNRLAVLLGDAFFTPEEARDALVDQLEGRIAEYRQRLSAVKKQSAKDWDDPDPFEAEILSRLREAATLK